MTAAITSAMETSDVIPIPSILTNSYRAIVEAFGDSIIELTANGSTITPNGSRIKELRKYAVTHEQDTHHRIEIDYSALTNGPNGEISNPLDSEARAAIDEYIITALDRDELNVQPDLSVTQLKVRITCEPLQEITAAQSSEFDLCFVADQAEDAVRDETRRLNSDRGLYDELDFNVKNLNIRSVVETATQLSQQSNWQCLSWQGPEDVQPRIDNRLAIRVNKHILPDKYGKLKPYTVQDDHILDILGENFDELDNENLEEEVEE